MDLNQINKVLPSILTSNTGGEMRLFASKGGKRRSKKRSTKKRRTNKKKGGKSRRARRTCF